MSVIIMIAMARALPLALALAVSLAGGAIVSDDDYLSARAAVLEAEDGMFLGAGEELSDDERVVNEYIMGIKVGTGCFYDSA